MEEEIMEKSNYCLNCKLKPCSNKGCPLGNNIPLFINKIKEERYKEAYETLCETTVLQAICGRICPHKKQCEGACVRGIKGEAVSIGELEAYIGDTAIKENYDIPFSIYSLEDEKLSNKKVAIVGGGPAGLTCAAFLARKNINVTIYEKYGYLGGLLVHGIPDFRLQKQIVEETVNKIIKLGIKVNYNMELGRNLYLDDLENKYDAIFLSFGANKSIKMGIEGENLKGVYGGNELLEYNLHPDYKGKTIAVIGGGNVAMDSARTIKRLGAKRVIVVYRRSQNEMPAEEKEYLDAKNENIEFLFKTNIVKILGNTKVEKIELIKTELIKKDDDKRLSPIEIEGSNYIIEADGVVMALGSKTEDFVTNLNLKLNKWQNIEIDEFSRTSNDKIFAGGDLVGSKQTVAWAAKSGRDAAKNIIKYLEC